MTTKTAQAENAAETMKSSGRRCTGIKKEAFLAAFREAGVIYSVCKKLGIGRQTVYLWLEDPEFRKQFDIAKEDFADQLEEELYKRVRDNTIKGKNDLALFCALKGNRREKFGDNILVTPSESLITFKVLRVEVVDYVKPELIDTPKQLQEGQLT